MRKHRATDDRLAGVAPGLAWLGVMLPYAPLHYLLFHEAAGRPAGTGWLEAAQELVLVMTSANPGGEPLVTGNDEAVARLAGIADAFVVHDRDIVVGCDDSVLRALPEKGPGQFQFVRRARGYTPRAIKLATRGAAGGRAGRLLQEHDLRDARRRGLRLAAHRRSRQRADVPGAGRRRRAPDRRSSTCGRSSSRTTCIRISTARGMRRGSPRSGACRRRPSSITTRTSRRSSPSTGGRGPCWDWPSTASVWASDGSAWGGELLHVDGVRCERLGRLRPLRLPGGDRAAREPWRMGAAALALAGRGDEIETRYSGEPAAATVAAVARARDSTRRETSSMGRWFDAAAGLLDVKRRMAFEGQAAMLLEGIAERHGAVTADPSLYTIGRGNELDLAPLLMRLAGERDAGHGAALFHATLVAALASWVARAAAERGLPMVAGGGGCFMNAILARGLRAALATARSHGSWKRRQCRRTTAAWRSARPGSRATSPAERADHVPRDSRLRGGPARARHRARRRGRRAEADLARAPRWCRARRLR